jgi:hypothetical protein
MIVMSLPAIFYVVSLPIILIAESRVIKQAANVRDLVAEKVLLASLLVTILVALVMSSDLFILVMLIPLQLFIFTRQFRRYRSMHDAQPGRMLSLALVLQVIYALVLLLSLAITLSSCSV